MSDKELIKEKMKEGKKKLKNDNKSFIGYIIFSVIQAVGIYIIPEETKFMPIVLLCYLVLSSFIYIKVYHAYKITKYASKKNYLLTNEEQRKYKKGFNVFMYSCIVFTIIVIFVRKLSFLSLLAPIINFLYHKVVLLDELPPSWDLVSSFYNLNLLDEIPKKAVKMQIKFVIIISLVLAFIGSCILSGISYINYINDEKDIIVVVIVIALIFSTVWNFIVKLVINLFTSIKEKTLNRAFDLNMGEWKDKKSDYISETKDIRYLYNYGIMYYKVLVILCSILLLLATTKFDVAVTLVLSTMYILLTYTLGYSDKDSHGKGGSILNTRTAWIKDSHGNTVGSVDYRV